MNNREHPGLPGNDITQDEIDNYIRIGNRLRSQAITAAIRNLFRWRWRRPSPSANDAAAKQGEIASKFVHHVGSSLAAIRCSGELLKEEPDLADSDRARFVEIILKEEARLEALHTQLVPYRPRQALAQVAGIETVLRQLRPWDRNAFRSHFQHLSRADRRMRFQGSVGEAFLDRHSGRVMSPSTIILGAFGERGLLGVSELSLTGPMWPLQAELAVSVDANFQNRGIGKALVRGALVLAQNRMIDKLISLCLRENARICHICREAGADITLSDGEATGMFVVPRADQNSLLGELSTEAGAILIDSLSYLAWNGLLRSC